MKLHLLRTVTSTEAEFSRALRLTRDVTISGAPPGFEVSNNRAALSITLAATSDLELGSLRMQRLRVEIIGLRGEQDDQQRLLACIDRTMQRGGG